MDPARICSLLDPFLDRPLTSDQLEQTSIYIDLLLRWNSRINLTAIRDPDEIVARHFGESFFLARHVFPDPAVGAPRTTDHRPLATVVDLGSGAGFPGLPVKIWAPGIHLTLVESNHKKAAFLREVVRALTLMNVDVIAERAEFLADRLAENPPPGPHPVPSTPLSEADVSKAPRLRVPISKTQFPKADVVTFRAVENFERTLPLALRFVAPRGSLAILISSAQVPPSALQLSPDSASLPPLASQSSPDPQGSASTPLQWRIYNIPESQKRLLAIVGRVGEPT